MSSHDRTLVLAADRRARQAATTPSPARRGDEPRRTARACRRRRRGMRVRRGVSPRRWLDVALPRAPSGGRPSSRRRGDTGHVATTTRTRVADRHLGDHPRCRAWCSATAPRRLCVPHRRAVRAFTSSPARQDRRPARAEQPSRDVVPRSPTLDVLLEAGDEFHELSHRRALLSEIDRVLEGGVGSGTCTVGWFSHELFTYEGSAPCSRATTTAAIERCRSTTSTRSERLVAHSARGFCSKPRSGSARSRSCCSGFGAWIDASTWAWARCTPRRYLADCCWRDRRALHDDALQGRSAHRTAPRRKLFRIEARDAPRSSFAVTANEGGGARFSAAGLPRGIPAQGARRRSGRGTTRRAANASTSSAST